MQELIKGRVYYTILNKEKRWNNQHLQQIQNNNIKRKYSLKELVTLKQIHSSIIVRAEHINHSSEIVADGSVTTAKNIGVSVMTADCAPVLLSCKTGKVAGVAHCGWRGAKSNIIANIVKYMRNIGAQDIIAVIGPSIAQKSYLVEQEYYDSFVKDEILNKELFIPHNKKYMFDLAGYVKRKLYDEQVEIKTHINEDTYSLPNKYPSYRRAMQKGERHKHNIVSIIVIR